MLLKATKIGRTAFGKPSRVKDGRIALMPWRMCLLVLAAVLSFGPLNPVPAKANHLVGLGQASGDLTYTSAVPTDSPTAVSWRATLFHYNSADGRALSLVLDAQGTETRSGGGGTVVVERFMADGTHLTPAYEGPYTRTSLTGDISGSILHISADSDDALLTADLVVSSSLGLCGAGSSCFFVNGATVIREAGAPSSDCTPPTPGGGTATVQATVCARADVAGVGLGGKGTVDLGVPTGLPQADGNQSSCANPASGGHYLLLQDTAVLGEGFVLEVNQQPEELWICFLSPVATGRVIVPTGGTEVGFQPDAP